MSSLTGNQKTNTFLNGSTGVHTFTTSAFDFGSVASSTNLRIVASIAILSKNNTLSSITSLTDFEGFTWHKAGSVSQVGITNPSGMTGAPLAEGLEIWYTDTFVSTDLTGGTTYTLTVNVDNDIDLMGVYFAIQKDIDTTVPLDANASFPASTSRNSSSTATMSLTGKTTNTSAWHTRLSVRVSNPVSAARRT
jgi:hypothetical protein